MQSLEDQAQELGSEQSVTGHRAQRRVQVSARVRRMQAAWAQDWYGGVRELDGVSVGQVGVW